MFQKSLFLQGLFLTVFLFTLFQAAAADLVKHGKSVSCIQLADNADKVEKHAARELAYFIRKQTGTEIPVSS